MVQGGPEYDINFIVSPVLYYFVFKLDILWSNL